MDIAFDPAEDRSNIVTHGLSLSRAEEMDMATAVIIADDRRDYGEDRYRAYGLIDGLHHCLVFTVRDVQFAPSAFAEPTVRRSSVMPREPRLDDPENPVWTEADFARARPAREVLSPEIIAAFKAKGGRPKAETPKESISIRLDPDIVAFYRASGPGWQTRINGALRRAMRRASSQARKTG